MLLVGLREGARSSSRLASDKRVSNFIEVVTTTDDSLAQLNVHDAVNDFCQLFSPVKLPRCIDLSVN
ncbi:hypothetical protein ES702_04377 [subsurface metagenome]